LLLAGMLALFSTMVSLPLNLYSTFVIESRHGFNQSTLRLFLTDQIKSLLLTVVIGGPIWAAVLWLIGWAGRNFYVAVWLLMMLVQLVLIIIYPTFIQPLFNRFTPLPQDSTLRGKIEALAKSLGFPLGQIFVVDGSRRSSHSNAYYFGLFKHKRIVLFDTLLEKDGMSEDEICAVVGHELGHWACKHTLKMLVLIQAHLLAIFYILSRTIDRPAIYAAFNFNFGTGSAPALIGLLICQQLLTPLELFIGLAQNWISRKHEFEADRFAISTLGYGRELPKALIKLYARNKNLVHSDWLYSTLHHSHPPPSERIAAIAEMTKRTS
jgi:STE24 endopeptidase